MNDYFLFLEEVHARQSNHWSRWHTEISGRAKLGTLTDIPFEHTEPSTERNYGDYLFPAAAPSEVALSWGAHLLQLVTLGVSAR